MNSQNLRPVSKKNIYLPEGDKQRVTKAGRGKGTVILHIIQHQGLGWRKVLKKLVMTRYGKMKDRELAEVLGINLRPFCLILGVWVSCES